MPEQEIAERRLCGPVGRLDVDRLAVGMLSLGDALLPVVGFTQAHVTVGIARVGADGAAKDRLRLEVASADQVQMAEGGGYFPQRIIELQRLAAGGFGLGDERRIACLVVTHAVALAQPGVRQRKLRILSERLVKALAGLLELRDAGRSVQLREPGEIQVERRQMGGRRLGHPLRELAR